MKRWIFTILLFLLLGAIVNIAVAWGCALWVDPFAGGSLTIGGRRVAGEYWCVDVIRRRGTLNARSDRVSGVDAPDLKEDPAPALLSPPWSRFDVPSAGYAAGRSDHEDRIVDAKGWPSLALWYESQAADRWTITGILGGIEIGDHWPPCELGEWTEFPKALPLRPIWPGFAINTAFYAFILWLLLSAPFVLRRVIRIKQGRCPKCGYELRHALSGGCPECGWGREQEVSA